MARAMSMRNAYTFVSQKIRKKDLDEDGTQYTSENVGVSG